MNRLQIGVRLESLGLPLRRALFEAGVMVDAALVRSWGVELTAIWYDAEGRVDVARRVSGRNPPYAGGRTFMAVARAVIDAGPSDGQRQKFIRPDRLEWVVIRDTDNAELRYNRTGNAVDQSKTAAHILYEPSGSGFTPNLVRGDDREPVLRQDGLGLPDKIIVWLGTPLDLLHGEDDAPQHEGATHWMDDGTNAEFVQQVRNGGANAVGR
jgi:hypothetical protein